LAQGLLNKQSMRIAIPIWQGRISPVFDVAGQLLAGSGLSKVV
jgi:hypothetical protein